MNILASNDFYEISIIDQIAILDIKEKVFDFITDIALSDKLLQFLDQIDHNPEIKALIFFNEKSSLNDEQYDRFINRILDRNKPQNDCESPCFCEKNIRFREINVLNKLILKISQLQILVISGLQGTVVTPFVGAAMVADFRFASEEAVFSMAHNRYGLHPSGALPYFLTKYLNHSLAMEFQLSDKISAKEAHEIGLINKLISTENFQEGLLIETRKYTNVKYCSIRETKRLTNFSRKELRYYFEYEADLLNL